MMVIKNNSSGGLGSFSAPQTIGSGGGSLFALFDINNDGYLDIMATQFFITAGLYDNSIAAGPAGDSLVWFKNPGSPAGTWQRYTIDRWNTSDGLYHIGKGNEVIVADIDNDGTPEIVLTNHNHQMYDDNDPPLRIWPSGIFYYEIPQNPEAASNWVAIPIELGNPLLDPTDKTAVFADVYGVDRRYDSPTSGYWDQGSPGMVRAADINKDGRMDIVVQGDGKGAIYYYEAQPPLSGLAFKRASLFAYPGCMPGDAKIVDIDNDGDLDIVSAVFDTSVLQLSTYTSGSIFLFEKEGHPPVCGNGEIEAGEECETHQDCLNIHSTGWGCNNCQCVQSTVVDLISFEAAAGWRRVTLKWETAAETDNAGFNVYRAETENGEYIKINSELIPAQGSATQSASYQFLDKGLKNGKTYYYKLEDIDLNGTASMHGPVSAMPRLLFGIFGKKFNKTY
jgi:hypothetical protein